MDRSNDGKAFLVSSGNLYFNFGYLSMFNDNYA